MDYRDDIEPSVIIFIYEKKVISTNEEKEIYEFDDIWASL